MSERCLITGISGFMGSHLADLMVAKGLETWGAVRQESPPNLAHLKGKLNLVTCDLRDAPAVQRAVALARPQYIFHLAGQTSVSRSWSEPAETYQVNLFGALHLLSAAAALSPPPTVVLVSSMAVYGFTAAEEMPIRENHALHPASPYAASKAAAELAALPFFYSKQLRVIRVRPFNITGPRKRGDAAWLFASRMLDAEAERSAEVRLAPPVAVRDFTDGRDAASALWLLATKGASGEVYNLCSGRGRVMQDILDMVLACARRPVPVVFDSSLSRAVDEPAYVGDNSKLRALGWTPQIPLEQTIRELVQELRSAHSAV
ncbi:MAG: NAD-dependent epimerase/dehydratase family protein [Dehalococcoidia bacterium]|nr:NAD-dependent epimerase/dehydratase family protein [Dehalococcoidia bacterium]